jgi:hypothetical protein
MTMAFTNSRPTFITIQIAENAADFAGGESPLFLSR